MRAPLSVRSLLPRREFWKKNYSEVKNANLKLPILLRECEGVSAKLTAVFGAARPAATALAPSPDRAPAACACAEKGLEKSVAVEGQSEVEFSKTLKDIMKA